MECHCSSVRPRDRLDSVHQCAPVCLRMFSNKAPRVLRQEGVPQAVVAAATAQFGRRCPTASPGGAAAHAALVHAPVSLLPI